MTYSARFGAFPSLYYPFSSEHTIGPIHLIRPVIFVLPYLLSVNNGPIHYKTLLGSAISAHWWSLSRGRLIEESVQLPLFVLLVSKIAFLLPNLPHTPKKNTELRWLVGSLLKLKLCGLLLVCCLSLFALCLALHKPADWFPQQLVACWSLPFC